MGESTNSESTFWKNHGKLAHEQNLAPKIIHGGKANFAWGQSQQQAFDDLKQRLCSSPVLSLLELQQPFEIETDALDYAVGTVLTQHNHPMSYHSETLLDVVHKYTNYDKEMYSIMQACHQWRHYIVGRETIIHIDHKPLQFI